MIARFAKITILFGGLGILAHQLWLLIRVARNGRVLRKPKSWQQRLGVVTVTLAFVAVVLLIFDTGNLSLNESWWSDFIRLVGLFCFIGGIFFRVWAIRSLENLLSPDLRITDRIHLITHGAYGVVRHPFYLSALLLLLGAGLALINIVLLGCLLPLWLILQQRIRLEEKMLAEYFGEAHTVYRQTVPALVPKLNR